MALAGCADDAIRSPAHSPQLPVFALAACGAAHTLPYKSAHFILTRALEDKPIKLPIRREGRQMHIATELKATRGRGGARGNYSLGIRACNPGCPK